MSLRTALLACTVAVLATTASAQTYEPAADRLQIAPGGRFLQHADGRPFAWQGDTGWLMLQRLSREETLHYLDDRAAKGFNVIQAMVIHGGNDTTSTGARAFSGGLPLTTPGANPAKAGEYDYWDHLDWVVDEAAKRGIYMALVPVWGSVVGSGGVTMTNAEPFARFLGERYRDRPNIIWLNGGDTHGDEHTDVWETMGSTIKASDPGHLMTFHPFGRMQSSEWFHNASWLDFNMFQSGHRTYAQEDPGARSEDNWRFVEEDLALKPTRPTVDGEPSYEGIPHGLHDATQPRWTAADARRYAYWSVFAGAFGHTYGDNSVMQMFRPGVTNPAYGATVAWDVALNDPGAGQMKHLTDLMLSRPFFDRVSDQGGVAGGPGVRYDRIAATRGDGYAMAYSYKGAPFPVRLGDVGAARVVAWWYDPRTGAAQKIGEFAGSGEQMFDPPGDTAAGNDWVLVLDDAARSFPPPGTPLPGAPAR